MKIINKIMISIIIIFLALFLFSNQNYNVKAQGIGELIDGANDFIQKGESDQSDTIDEGKLQEGINMLYSIAVAIGTFVATIVGVIVGIKLMTAASADEKAQYKKILIVYLAGCVVIFGAVGIWRLVVNTINGVI